MDKSTKKNGENKIIAGQIKRHHKHIKVSANHFMSDADNKTEKNHHKTIYST